MRHIAIALALLASGSCRPKAAPTGPGVEPQPGTTVVDEPTAKLRPAARQVLIGEMCPKAAAGRPAVLPIFIRGVTWAHDSDEVSIPIERRSARRFSVHRWDGTRAGVFSVAGSARMGLDRPVAIGAYAGGSPCIERKDGADVTIDACVASQSNCGLAIAVLEPGGGFSSRPFEEDPDPVQLSTAGACAVEGKLLVDIDGDGSPEAYNVDDFLDPVRAPAEEVTAIARAHAKCKPAFANRNILPPGDPRHWRGMDLLGVIDIDEDGLFEVVVAYHYSDRRTWAIYSAISSTARLELVGEAVPWPRP